MKHIPVMLQESLEIFQEQKLSSFFDGTLGAGGFARALLEAHPEIETYYGCDQDTNALQLARENLKEFEGKVEFIHSNFSFVKKVLKQRGAAQVDGFFLIWECHPCN
ncbi:MAG: 16S rRNA (cytosine(1402)-N(4))-methyltransferase [Simkaniaceae bacterium]|nr:16S rRNA (cytosine(1402)-N(4))-methyltransferase [Simkaniaceae bacterium]